MSSGSDFNDCSHCGNAGILLYMLVAYRYSFHKLTYESVDCHVEAAL